MAPESREGPDIALERLLTTRYQQPIRDADDLPPTWLSAFMNRTTGQEDFKVASTAERHTSNTHSATFREIGNSEGPQTIIVRFVRDDMSTRDLVHALIM